MAPVRLTVCGLLLALSVTVRVPVVAAPDCVGENVMLIVQPDQLLSVAPQVLLEMLNGPVVVGGVVDEVVRVEDVALIRATCRGALVCPIFVPGKLKVLGVNPVN